MVKQVNLSSPWQLRKVSSPKIAQQEQICDYDQFTTSVVSNVIFLEVHPLLDELKTKFKSQFTRTTTLKHWSPVSLSFFFFFSLSILSYLVFLYPPQIQYPCFILSLFPSLESTPHPNCPNPKTVEFYSMFIPSHPCYLALILWCLDLYGIAASFPIQIYRLIFT